MKPTVGRIVQYRQKRGSQAWLPAIVTVTEETFVPGLWVEGNEVRDHLRGREHIDGREVAIFRDADDQVWVPSEIPPVKPPIMIDEAQPDNHHIHLVVFSPLGGHHNYPEFNVQEGEEPGMWRWPPRESE